MQYYGRQLASRRPGARQAGGASAGAGGGGGAAGRRRRRRPAAVRLLLRDRPVSRSRGVSMAAKAVKNTATQTAAGGHVGSGGAMTGEAKRAHATGSGSCAGPGCSARCRRRC